MNLLEKAAAKIFPTFFRKSFSFGDGFIRGIGELDFDGSDQAWQNSAFAACLQTLITSYNEPRLTVKRAVPGEKEPVELVGHPLTVMLSRPNPYYTGRRLAEGYMTSRAIDGNGYIRKIYNQSRTKLLELWYLPHWTVTPVTNPGDPFISSYRFNANQQQQVIPASEMIHLRWGVNPQDPRVGLSPVKLLLKELNADTEAALYTMYTLRNPAPGLLLTPGADVELTADNATQIREEIERKTERKGANRVIALTAPMTLAQFGHSPKDVNVGELRRIPEERISAVLGVPSILAGLGAGLDRGTMANFKEAGEVLTERTMVPLWNDIGEEFTHQALPDFDGYQVTGSDGKRYTADSTLDYVCFDLSNVRSLQEDVNAKFDRTRKDWQADGLTHGEYRAAMNMAPDPAREKMYFSQVVGTDPSMVAAKSLIETVKRRTNESRAMLEELNAGTQDSQT